MALLQEALINGKEAAMAKLYTSEIAREVVNEALQIHGAHGLL